MTRFVCSSAEWSEDVEKEQLFMILHIPEAREAFRKLMDGASQLDLSFDGRHDENGSVITFIFRNGNGEVGVDLPKRFWEPLLNEPDRLILDYGKTLEMDFLPRAFFKFIDEQIERYNQGEEDPFIKDIVEVFAEE